MSNEIQEMKKVIYMGTYIYTYMYVYKYVAYIRQ